MAGSASRQFWMNSKNFLALRFSNKPMSEDRTASIGSGHLGDLAVTVDVGSSDLLELEVASDIGVDEHLCELTVGHDKLRDKIDGPVTVTTPILGRFGTWTELL